MQAVNNDFLTAYRHHPQLNPQCGTRKSICVKFSSSGHIVCRECQPSLSRCPICNIKYRKILMQDFFAEKLLELLERKCRYEIFGCDFCTKVSSDLVEHETTCQSKPPVPVKRWNKKNQILIMRKMTMREMLRLMRMMMKI